MEAARIAMLRKEKKLSQKQLAEALHVHQTAVSQWETGRTSPDRDTLSAIADYFEVSLDYLLGRTDDRDGTIAITAPEAKTPIDKITIFSRNARKLSSEEWEQLQSVARLLFKKVFDENENEGK